MISKRLVSLLTMMSMFSFTPASPLSDNVVQDNAAAAGQPVESLSVKHSLRLRFDKSGSRKRKRNIVKQYAYWYATVELGLSPDEFWMVHDIWELESHWNWQAVGIKTSSGRAKGIPQVKWSRMIKDPFRQVEKGFDYILHTYGTVEAAYKFKLKHGWY